uniref:Ras GTPase-activating protein-binding protein 1 n=1 Tax=Chrysemys picta bellii TaxID=8478 RepID=A0A8C3FZD5_CHRPI
MVMEKPSPLLVGREFVRQYYTLLNQAPDYLHRFYGKNSSYVHGGLDSNGKPADAVYGQSDIHKKVLSLNFKDCHTKIRHVDAHATLNDGVVVQVMGELSNNMQPVRRFMQTFVLAPEGSVANKFYVHNDIFRYQDEVFGDSDTEPPEGNKNLPPSGAVPVLGIPPHVVKVPASQPRPESKPESQTPSQRPQRDQRVREQRTSIPPQRGPRPIREGEQGDMETRRIVRYPDSHQLFVGNLPHDVDKTELKDFFQKLGSSLADYGNVVELRINSGGKLPNFGFVVFDDPEPVQKILSNRPIMFRGEVRLNVEEKKTRAAREGDRRDNRPRGPGGTRGGLGGGIRGPPRGGMSQKPGFGAGRGIGQRQ